MDFTALAIKRPVGTMLLTLALFLAGALGMSLLPISSLPQVEFPTIMVSANLLGASPETMAAIVASPLERQLGRIAGVKGITSSSYQSTTYVTVQFVLDRDIDGAARDVQAAINAARRELPATLSGNPTYRKVNPADAPILILALTSHNVSRERMFDLATTLLQPKLSQVQGVGQVSVSGGALPAVRVQVNPYALAQYNLGSQEVRQLLARANANSPKGQVSDTFSTWDIVANDQLRQAAEYAPLILAYHAGAAVKLEDVAKVIDSAEDVRTAGFVDSHPAVLLTISRQHKANIVRTADAVRELLPQLEASLPAEVRLSVILDRTPPVRQSLREMALALVISCALVVLVVFCFLGSLRITFIPSLAMLVSLVGTGAFMYLAGLSLDNLSLMALIVASGLVVDDAIIVLENIVRRRDRDTPLPDLVAQGARQISFTVVAMSLSLIAVFIPILLMGGLIGRIVQEFALVLSAAILLSMLVSLSATPVMCAKLLRSQEREPEGKFQLRSARLLAQTLSLYDRSLHWTLGHPRLLLGLTLLSAGLAFHLYLAMPKGFFPQQDTGRLMGVIRASQDISFAAMEKKLKEVMAIIKADPDVEDVSGFTGTSITATNVARMFINLKPLDARTGGKDLILSRLRKKLAQEPGAATYLQMVQDLRIGARSASATYQYTLQGDSIDELNLWSPRVVERLKHLPQLEDVNADLSDKGLRTYLDINRPAASRLGVSVRTIDDTLYDFFGQRQVSTIYGPQNQYRVILEAEPAYSQFPSSLGGVYAPTSADGQAPLSALARQETITGPLNVNHQGQRPAVTIAFNLASGASLGQAVHAIEEAIRQLALPASLQGTLQGSAQAFQDSLRTQPLLILAALAAVYIVLGMLYESYVHPLTIISSLPSAGLGALLIMSACGQELNVMGFIGIVLLIGLVMKNGILMVDFARDAQRSQGLAPVGAIHQACLVRFRPIMMTTLAALLGALPLALGQGMGAELRRPLGLSIIGGLLVSQFFTLYATPVIYVYIARLRRREPAERRRPPLASTDNGLG